MIALCCVASAAGCHRDAHFFDETRWVLSWHFDTCDNVFCGYSFSPNSDYFVSACLDGNIRLYRTVTGHLEKTWNTPQQGMWRALYSPDGKKIVTLATEPSLIVWDAQTQRILADSTGSQVRVDGVAWSPDGGRLVTIDGTSTVAHVWSASDLKVVGTLKGHADFITDAQFSPKGARIVSISYDATVRVWHARTFEALAVLDDHPDRILCMAFSPKGEYLVTAGLRTQGTKPLIVWDTATLSPVRRLKHSYDVTGVSFSPDGTSLLTSDGFYNYAWNPASGRYLGKMKRLEYALDAAEFSPNGRYAITMDYKDESNQKLFLWTADSENR